MASKLPPTLQATLPKLGDVVGHPFQTNPQVDPRKKAVADNAVSPLSSTITSKKREDGSKMQGVAWYGKHDVRVEQRPVPTITDPEDIIIRVTSSAICGSDLHLYEGYMVGMQKGDLLGHEPMGIVEEVGPAVQGLTKGDRVVVSFDLACSHCNSCKRGLYSSCDTTNSSQDEEALYGHKTGGFLGYSHMTGGYEGGQAEFLRVPFANTNTLKVPPYLSDEKVLFLSDALCTGWHATEMGDVGPGRNVAIWGAGPVGIFAAMCAFERGASRVVLIDKEEYRLEHAAKHIKGLETINYSKTKVDAELRAKFPETLGPDTSIEAAGFHYAKTLIHTVEQKLGMENDPSDILNELIRCTRKGGCISIVGVYSGFTNHFNIGGMMEKGITMRGGQTPVQRYWNMLLQKIEEGRLNPEIVITHVLPMSQAKHAYDIFNKKQDGCIKVILKPQAAEPAGAQ